MSNRQTILDYLVNTLFATMTTGNSYNFTVATRERGLVSYENMTDNQFPALYVASADEERKNVTNKDFISMMTVYIYGYVKQSTVTLRTQVELDKLIEDLTKALYANPTQAGKVAWTQIKSVVTDDGDLGEFAVFKMAVEFSYKAPGTAP